MLPNPPRSLNSVTIQTVQVSPSTLYRISPYASGEPYFGRNASNRFDDPTLAKSRRYGTCYMGESLEVAIAETVLHDGMPVRGRFEVAATELERRSCVRFAGGMPLTLANLTGTALKTLVGSSDISTVVPCNGPQRWARALYSHQQQVDGLIYMSRQINDRRAVVVFDRAANKLGLASYEPLTKTSGAR